MTSRVRLAAALLLAAALVLAGGMGVRWRQRGLEADASAYWLRILDSNGRQGMRVVNDWLEERRQDALVAAGASVRAMGAGGGGAPGYGDVRDPLGSIVRHEGFLAGWAVAPGGQVLAAVGAEADAAPDSLDGGERAAVAEAVRSGQVAVAGPWRDRAGKVALSFVAPVREGGTVLGAVVLRADVGGGLLADMAWSLEPSRTGQARLLVARGDSIHVLSPSRFPAAGPMELGMPRAAAPALWRAALASPGAAGTFAEGGRTVLAATHPVAQPGWALVRSIDHDEALAPEHQALRGELLLLVAAMVAVGLGTALGRRQWRVAALRRTDAALRDSEARHRMLFERNPLPMWLYDAESLRILAVNTAAVRTYGYSREEFLRLTLTDLRRPEDAPELLENRGVAGSGRRDAGVFRHRRKDGSTLAVEVMSDDAEVAGRPARLVLAHDVTVRHAAERSLREAHALLATVIDSAPVAIVALDRGARVRNWNAAAERIFGWSAAEVLGQLDPIHPPEDERDGVDLLQAIVDRGESVDREVRRLRRDGSVIDVHLSAAPLRDDAGAITGAVAFLADVSGRVHLEEQLRHAQKMEAVGRLAGGVAHDFNNLLTAMKGYGEFIREALEPDSPLRGDLEEMLAAADRAAALTRQLLVFSRKQVSAPREVDVDALVRDLHKLLGRVVGEDIRFELRLDSAGAAVRADPDQLHQVLMNLAVNARDAMPDGGELRVSTDVLAQADVAAAGADVAPAPDGFVRIRVRDTGTGMTADVMERLFEPFFTTKEPGKGTGLGLATVYGIVQQAGGWVGADSTPGDGATFTILLPRVPATPRAHPGDPGTETPCPPSVGLVMVVEDEPGVRALVRRTLVRYGYRVVDAENGRAALELADTLGEPIDLLVTDVVMPEMRGTHLAQELGRRRPGLRVLFISGYPDRGAALGDQLTDDAALLRKPFSPAELVDAVRAALAR